MSSRRRVHAGVRCVSVSFFFLVMLLYRKGTKLGKVRHVLFAV